VRIAHLTDLHLRRHLPGTSAIARRECRRVPSLLDLAVRRLCAAPPDLLVCTGDLLDYPLDRFADPDMLALAAQDLALIAGLLGTLPCPMLVLPGNHDPLEATLTTFPVPPETAVGDCRVLAFVDREGPGRVPQREGAERERYCAALSSADPRPQVHLQHYVIAPRPAETDYPYCYADADALRDGIASDGRVRAVLSGHYHPGQAPTRFGGTWFATAPAFCEAPYPVWLYDTDAPALRVGALAFG